MTEPIAYNCSQPDIEAKRSRRWTWTPDPSAAGAQAGRDQIGYTSTREVTFRPSSVNVTHRIHNGVYRITVIVGGKRVKKNGEVESTLASITYSNLKPERSTLYRVRRSKSLADMPPWLADLVHDEVNVRILDPMTGAAIEPHKEK